MASRRYGGGGNSGPQRGARSFSQQCQSNNVNPWQGGVTPGNTLSNDLQLTPQLAFAISSLLQSHQQQPVNNSPPSLLSLNTSPGFVNQDNFRLQNRFGNRGRSDFKRTEPYTKHRNNLSGGTWRTESSVRSNSNYNRSSSSLSSNRSNSRSNFNRDKRSPIKEKFDHKSPSRTSDKGAVKPFDKLKTSMVDDKKTDKVVDISSNIQDEDKSSQNVDNAVDENRDEDVKEKKREWKQEKNYPEADDSKEDACKSENMYNTEDDSMDTSSVTRTRKEKDSRNKRTRDSQFHGVPANLLHCFVCNKSMWDGESFQNHIRGRAHKQMMNSLDESFQITVKILRENMRLTEEKKMIEWDRMQRSSRNVHRKMHEPESHCNMCDLKFLGKIVAHRKTEGHQRLKRFLHPKCQNCEQEFPSRLEWVEHHFTPEHLRHLKEVIDKQTGEKADGFLLEQNLEMDNEPLLEESLQMEDEHPVLELSSDLMNLQNRIPAYIPNRAVSTESLKPCSGFTCDLCNRFLATELLAQAHLKTQGHYHKFVDALKTKYKTINNDKVDGDDDDCNRKRRKVEELEESQNNIPDETGVNSVCGNDAYDPEEACNEEDEPEQTLNVDENDSKLQESNETDDKWAEVDKKIDKLEDAEEVETKINPEPETSDSEKPTSVLRTARTGVALRSGPGPKSRTRNRNS